MTGAEAIRMAHANAEMAVDNVDAYAPHFSGGDALSSELTAHEGNVEDTLTESGVEPRSEAWDAATGAYAARVKELTGRVWPWNPTE